jgi:hypothetical protein
MEDKNKKKKEDSNAQLGAMIWLQTMKSKHPGGHMPKLTRKRILHNYGETQSA